ncbi:MAG: phytoene desaturase family protein [Candidatus Thorarchaeota archaeon]
MVRKQGVEGTNSIVIGGGIGGLAAAIRMQAAGSNVTLLEKRHQLGGRASVFKRKGYTFDTGPTIITPPFLLDDLFSAAGRKRSDYFDMVQISPKYRLYFSDGSHMDYAGHDENIQEIERLNSNDVKGYEKFMRRIKPIYELGFEKFGSQAFETPWSMAKVAPQGVWHKAYKSVYGMVSSYLKDDRMRIALSFNPLFIGGNPFAATAIYCLITYIEEKHGVWWVRGGTHKFIEAMERLLKELGGKVELNSEVNRINVSEGKHVKGVETAAGKTYDADLVIANSDIATTYTKMIDSQYRRRNSNRRYRRSKYSMSLFMTYMGVKKQFPEMQHHSIVFGPRYKGLLDDIFKKHVIPDDFSTYLHIPTRTDPELAPEGCETMYACTPVSNLDSGTDWEEKKESFRDHIFETLDRSVLPGLVDNIEVSSVFTPADYAKEFDSYKGAAFSLQPILLQSGWFRPHNRSKDIKGLYFAGAGTHPGAGVPSVVMSADITTQLIFRDAEGGKL